MPTVDRAKPPKNAVSIDVPDEGVDADADYSSDLDDTGPTPERLATAVNLALEQIRIEDEIANLNRDLEQRQRELRGIAEVDLPAALSLTGLRQLPLANGMTVSVDEKIVAGITKADQAEAYAWLRGTGHGDLIKRTVAVVFGKGQDAIADHLLDLLMADLALKKQKIDDKEAVHPQTLGAFVREQVALGTELPPSIGVTTLRRAVVARPKAPVLADAI